MSIPKYHEIFHVILICLNDDKIHGANEVYDYCANSFHLTSEELAEKLTSGLGKFKNRVGWAKTYLAKAGLIEIVSRGNYRLTKAGKKAAGENKIDLNYLSQFDSFKSFIVRKSNSESGKSSKKDDGNSEETPIEAISSAIREINASLADDLMTEIFKLSPSDFESLVVKLLIKMGYGSEELNINAVTKASGDEGIDGCIMADHFGFDSIYTQAKRWKTTEVVGRPEIQKFLGALAGKGATKGLYITTSKFSKEAKEFAQKQLQHKIILVDGEGLTSLMIKNNVGVSTVATYEVKRIDSDFFNDEF